MATRRSRSIPILPPELAAAVLEALGNAGPDGMPVPEIMAATGSNSQWRFMDTLLFKMNEAGEIARIKRGIYAARKDASKDRTERKKRWSSY